MSFTRTFITYRLIVPKPTLRSFSTSLTKMAPPAPTGLFSNRYKLEDIPDLSGKVAIVTGGTRGIGESLVKALAKKNAEGEGE